MCALLRRGWRAACEGAVPRRMMPRQLGEAERADEEYMDRKTSVSRRVRNESACWIYEERGEMIGFL